jgi:hypothetical protein
MQLEGWLTMDIIDRHTRVEDAIADKHRSPAVNLARMDNLKLREAYEMFLKSLGPYIWFVTLTFLNQNCSRTYVENRLHELSKRVDRTVYGHAAARSRKHRVKFVAALETNSSDGYHLHLLIIKPMEEPRRLIGIYVPICMQFIWEELDGAGDNNDFCEYDPHIHLSYITKQLWFRDNCIYLDWV